MAMKTLVKKIDAFLNRHRMEPTAFGLMVANDGHLYFDLVGGRKLRRKTEGKILDFMKHYRAARRGGK